MQMLLLAFFCSTFFEVSICIQKTKCQIQECTDANLPQGISSNKRPKFTEPPEKRIHMKTDTSANSARYKGRLDAKSVHVSTGMLYTNTSNSLCAKQNPMVEQRSTVFMTPTRTYRRLNLLFRGAANYSLSQGPQCPHIFDPFAVKTRYGPKQESPKRLQKHASRRKYKVRLPKSKLVAPNPPAPPPTTLPPHHPENLKRVGFKWEGVWGGPDQKLVGECKEDVLDQCPNDFDEILQVLMLKTQT